MLWPSVAKQFRKKPVVEVVEAWCDNCQEFWRHFGHRGNGISANRIAQEPVHFYEANGSEVQGG